MKRTVFIAATFVFAITMLVANTNPISNVDMVLVKGGEFQMGNTRGDPEGYEDELPIQTVLLTYDFWIGRYELTFEEYDSFTDDMGLERANDMGWGRERRPVIQVSWYDAIAYCNWLSEKHGLKPAYDQEGTLLDIYGEPTSDISRVEGFRLPTEAEWEYAGRGGHKSEVDYRYAGSNDIEEVAWYWYNWGMAQEKTQVVGRKKPNELGLFDMSGNVWEWCYDWYDREYYSDEPKTNPIGPAQGERKVRKSGSWYWVETVCRLAFRFGYEPDRQFINVGFRIARTDL